jgi:hypothetical protein
MTAAIDVEDFAGDVIVLDEENNRVHDISRRTRPLEQRSLHSKVFLILRVVFRKQHRARRDAVYLNRRCKRLGQAAIDGNESRLRNTVGHVTGPHDFTGDIDEIHNLAVAPPLKESSRALSDKKRSFRIRVHLPVPKLRSRLFKRACIEGRRVVDEDIETSEPLHGPRNDGVDPLGCRDISLEWKHAPLIARDGRELRSRGSQAFLTACTDRHTASFFDECTSASQAQPPARPCNNSDFVLEFEIQWSTRRMTRPIVPLVQ